MGFVCSHSDFLKPAALLEVLASVFSELRIGLGEVSKELLLVLCVHLSTQEGVTVLQAPTPKTLHSKP